MGVKEGYPSKSGYFTTIGLFSMKTVEDRYRVQTCCLSKH